MKLVRNISLLVAGSALAWYIWYNVHLSQKLIYGYQNVKFRGISKGQINLSLDMTIKNTTDLNVNIRGVDIDVYANGVFITTVFSNIEVTIAPNKTTEMPIILAIDSKSVLGNVQQVLFGAGSISDIQLKVKGKIKVRKNGIPLPIPFTYTSPLSDYM